MKSGRRTSDDEAQTMNFRLLVHQEVPDLIDDSRAFSERTARLSLSVEYVGFGRHKQLLHKVDFIVQKSPFVPYR